jgi:hypothetical protein
MLPLQVKSSDVLSIDNVDPRAYLEQFIVDSTCEVCLETLVPCLVCLEGNPAHYVSRVTRIWMAGIFQRDGYKLKHSRWWKLCDRCRLKLSGRDDLYGFSRFVFPVIRNVAQPDLLEQLISLQPMVQPNPQVFYMDFAHEAVRVPRGERRELEATRVRAAHDDLMDAVLEAVRGHRANGIVLDDATWRLDADPGEPNV